MDGLFNYMMQGITTHSIEHFRMAIAQGYDVNSYMYSYNTTQSIRFVEFVAQSDFASALRFLLVDTNPSRIMLADARRAFHASVASNPPRSIVSSWKPVFKELIPCSTSPTATATSCSISV